jgi:hypothetical protein
MKHLRTSLRILLLAGIAACAIVTVAGTSQRRETGNEHLAATARLYEPVREHVKQIDAIGFASFRDSEYGYLMRYYVAQSALAPTLVSESTDPDVVLASFGEDWRLEEFLASQPFVERARFPGGVAILERRP